MVSTYYKIDKETPHLELLKIVSVIKIVIAVTALTLLNLSNIHAEWNAGYPIIDQEKMNFPFHRYKLVNFLRYTTRIVNEIYE